MTKRKFLEGICSLVIVALAVTILPAGMKANEGVVELKNTQGGDARCWAGSILMTNFKYEILLSCRDLIYPAPAGSDLFNYVLWAQEQEDKVSKLGTLGVGRGQFATANPFVRLFVTQEKDDRVRKPSDQVIMSGYLSSIQLLESPSVNRVQAEETLGNAFLEPERELPQSTPMVTTQVVNRGFSLLKVVGGVLLGIIVFVVIVGVISASRRRPLE